MRCWRCPSIFAIHISTTRLFELLIKANTFKCTQTQKTPTQAANHQLGFHSSHTDPSYTHSVRKMHRIAEATGEGSASRAQKQCAPIGALPDSARVLQSDDGGGAAAALRLGAKRRSAAQQMGATVAAVAASMRRLPSAACDQSAVSRLGVSGICIAAAWRTPALKQPDAIKNGLSLVSPDLTLWAALLPPAPAVIQQGAEAKRANRRLT